MIRNFSISPNTTMSWEWNLIIYSAAYAAWGIINFTMKGLLWGLDSAAFEIKINSQPELLHESKEQEPLGRKGPLSQLHNSISQISQSLQRRDQFQEKVQLVLGSNIKALALIQGNTTR